MATTPFNPALIQKNLSGVDYPASKEDLIEAAQGNDAPDEVNEILEMLPDQEYATPAEVMEALGGEEGEE